MYVTLKMHDCDFTYSIYNILISSSLNSSSAIHSQRFFSYLQHGYKLLYVTLLRHFKHLIER